MNNEKLLEAIGMINDEAIQEAKQSRRPVSRHWTKWVAAAACFCIVICACVIAIPMFHNEQPPGKFEAAAIEFSSVEDFISAVQSTDANDNTSILHDVDHFYLPLNFITEAHLNTIVVSERYICLYYSLNEINPDGYISADEEEIARISSTIKFEWTRNADGNTLLSNTVTQLNLSKLADGIYYYDISYPTDTDHILSKSFYWVTDGYMFNLDIPIEVYSEIENRSDLTDLITASRRIEIN